MNRRRIDADGRQWLGGAGEGGRRAQDANGDAGEGHWGTTSVGRARTGQAGWAGAGRQAGWAKLTPSYHGGTAASNSFPRNWAPAPVGGAPLVTWRAWPAGPSWTSRPSISGPRACGPRHRGTNGPRRKRPVHAG